MTFTRREALAAAAAGVVAGTAGCLGILNGGGGTNSRLREWVPARVDVDGGGDVGSKITEYHDYTAYGGHNYDPTEEVGDERIRLRRLGIEDDVEADVWSSDDALKSAVFFGSFDAESVQSSFDGDRVGEYRGAMLLQSGSSGVALGVTDSVVVYGRTLWAEKSTEIVRRLLDTHAGDVDRATADVDFEKVISPVENKDFVSITQFDSNATLDGALQEAVATSVGATLRSERIYLTQVYVFESTDATDTDAIREETSLRGRYTSVESSGRTVTVNATFDPPGSG